MRIAVTGGAGFIGANLVARLERDPAVAETIVIDDCSTGFAANLDGVGKTKLVRATILDRDAVEAALAGAHSVVHLAAIPSVPRSVADPVASHNANATGTLTVLEACRAVGVEHVVVASSSSVYGDTPTLPKHEGLPATPRSPYAASKLATEAYALAYGAAYGLRTLAFRFFNVFGPLQAAGHAYAAVVPAFVSAAIAGHPLPVHGDGGQTRDFTFVGSVVEVLAAAARDRVTSSTPVNLAFGSRYSLIDLIDLLERIVGHPLEREHLPSRPGDVRDSQADQTRLRGLFPDIDPVSLSDGLTGTVAWFRAGEPRPWHGST